MFSSPRSLSYPVRTCPESGRLLSELDTPGWTCRQRVSAPVIYLPKVDIYALKQTPKKHENRVIEYSKTRTIVDQEGLVRGARVFRVFNIYNV